MDKIYSILQKKKRNACNKMAEINSGLSIITISIIE